MHLSASALSGEAGPQVSGRFHAGHAGSIPVARSDFCKEFSQVGSRLLAIAPLPALTARDRDFPSFSERCGPDVAQ